MNEGVADILRRRHAGDVLRIFVGERLAAVRVRHRGTEIARDEHRLRHRLDVAERRIGYVLRVGLVSRHQTVDLHRAVTRHAIAGDAGGIERLAIVGVKPCRAIFRGKDADRRQELQRARQFRRGRQMLHGKRGEPGDPFPRRRRRGLRTKDRGVLIVTASAERGLRRQVAEIRSDVMTEQHFGRRPAAGHVAEEILAGIERRRVGIGRADPVKFLVAEIGERRRQGRHTAAGCKRRDDGIRRGEGVRLVGRARHLNRIAERADMAGRQIGLFRIGAIDRGNNRKVGRVDRGHDCGANCLVGIGGIDLDDDAAAHNAQDAGASDAGRREHDRTGRRGARRIGERQRPKRLQRRVALGDVEHRVKHRAFAEPRDGIKFGLHRTIDDRGRRIAGGGFLPEVKGARVAGVRRAAGIELGIIERHQDIAGNLIEGDLGHRSDSLRPLEAVKGGKSGFDGRSGSRRRLARRRFLRRIDRRSPRRHFHFRHGFHLAVELDHVAVAQAAQPE